MTPMKATITETYRNLNSIRLGLEPIKNGQLTAGLITVRISGDEEQKLECTYNQTNGILSGLSKLYKLGYFDSKTEVEYEILTINEISILLDKAESKTTVEKIEKSFKTIFENRKLKHIHIEPFRPENLKNWTPKTEGDIYLIFGLLEEYTDFKYCCGTNAALLKKLGYKYDSDNAKPDAILINRTTEEYMIAEFKLKSSQFTTNHKKDDIDVLVIWEDDEQEKEKLPEFKVVLSDIAKAAAIDILKGE